jgi:hypothetical protein
MKDVAAKVLGKNPSHDYVNNGGEDPGHHGHKQRR